MIGGDSQHRLCVVEGLQHGCDVGRMGRCRQVRDVDADGDDVLILIGVVADTLLSYERLGSDRCTAVELALQQWQDTGGCFLLAANDDVSGLHNQWVRQTATEGAPRREVGDDRQ